MHRHFGECAARCISAAVMHDTYGDVRDRQPPIKSFIVEYRRPAIAALGVRGNELAGIRTADRSCLFGKSGLPERLLGESTGPVGQNDFEQRR
jgi:hypothetical protein